MTTNVKIEAHCNSDTQVQVVIDSQQPREECPPEVKLLEDGDIMERSIYDDLEISVREIPKTNYQPKE